MRRSAGVLLYRRNGGVIEVLLAHPGGPLWANRDSWGVPKGLVETGEELLDAARRELAEETGLELEAGVVPDLIALGVVARRHKVVHVWAYELDIDPSTLHSNTFEMEWPPRSGRRQSFPELDRFALFDLATAREKIHDYQRPLLDRLREQLDKGGGDDVPGSAGRSS